jgi:hypothetical protein
MGPIVPHLRVPGDIRWSSVVFGTCNSVAFGTCILEWLVVFNASTYPERTLPGTVFDASIYTVPVRASEVVQPSVLVD